MSCVLSLDLSAISEAGRVSPLSPFSGAEVLTYQLSEGRCFTLERYVESPGTPGVQGGSAPGPALTALLEHNSRWCHSHRIQYTWCPDHPPHPPPQMV